MSAEEVWIYRKTTAVTDRRYKEQQVLQRSRIFVNQNDHFRQIPNAVWPKWATLAHSAYAVPVLEMRLAKLTTEKEKTESELSKCKSENENVASLPKTFVELNEMIDGVLDNQDIRRKVANVVHTLVRKITLDIADKFNPSFNVHLINGEQINWEYDINEFSQPIIGIGKNGGFILGKGKVLDGNYSIKGKVKTP